MYVNILMYIVLGGAICITICIMHVCVGLDMGSWCLWNELFVIRGCGIGVTIACCALFISRLSYSNEL